MGFLSTHAGVGESLGYVDYRNGQTCNDITVKPSGIFGGQNRNEWGSLVRNTHRNLATRQLSVGACKRGP